MGLIGKAAAEGYIGNGQGTGVEEALGIEKTNARELGMDAAPDGFPEEAIEGVAVDPGRGGEGIHGEVFAEIMADALQDDLQGLSP